MDCTAHRQDFRSKNGGVSKTIPRKLVWVIYTAYRACLTFNSCKSHGLQSTSTPCSKQHLLVLLGLPDCSIVSIAIWRNSERVIGVPAMAKGAPKPTAEGVVSKVQQGNSGKRVVADIDSPMKPQYLTAKNLVMGLNGMLLRGPSG